MGHDRITDEPRLAIDAMEQWLNEFVGPNSSEPHATKLCVCTQCVRWRKADELRALFLTAQQQAAWQPRVTPLPQWQSFAPSLSAAIGLAASERNRWESHTDDRTFRHWRDVVVRLNALLLCLETPDNTQSGSTRSRIAD